MLRESSTAHEESVNLDAIMEGGSAGDILHGAELIAFAEAIVSRDANLIQTAREALVKVADSDVMVDAAGVASNFQRMVRIADSTGITLGDSDEPTADLRETLGINTFKTDAP